jgi:hypothetical protein
MLAISGVDFGADFGVSLRRSSLEEHFEVLQKEVYVEDIMSQLLIIRSSEPEIFN